MLQQTTQSTNQTESKVAASNASDCEELSKIERQAEQPIGIWHRFGTLPVQVDDVPAIIQPKLTINQPGDVYEQEADRMAEHVMRMSDSNVPGNLKSATAIQRKCAACGSEVEEEQEETLMRKSMPGILQRKCAACEAEEKEGQRESALMRKSEGSGGFQASPALTAQLHATKGGGSPLPISTRTFMESAFQADFSDVRVHTDSQAAAMSHGIHARAFTHGQDIYFNRWEYVPENGEGKRLLAHELVHTLQQSAVGGKSKSYPIHIMRQSAPFHTRRFQERGGGGTTDFVETVQNQPQRNGDIISGTVERSEIAPAVGSNPEQEISSGRVNVEFNTVTCELKVPYKIDFQQAQSAGSSTSCQSPPSATVVQPLPQARFQEIRRQYIRHLNDSLNGLFTVRIVPGCGPSCAGRDIPIQIEAQDSSSNPDKIIQVVNRGGRGDAGTICAGSFDEGFITHESGHQVLGVGDEYREPDPVVRQRTPRWARDERVRTDLTHMGSTHTYGRFALFHERHFRFAQIFLEAAFPGCTVTLQAVPRTIPDFRLQFDVGYSLLDGGNAVNLGIGFDVGLPLSRLRQTELLLGVRGRYMAQIAGEYRSVFLAGAQVGIEHRTSPADLGASFGAFAGGGLSYQLDTDRTSPYLEAGGSIGLTPSMRSFLRGELGVGTELADDEARQWFRAGVSAGFYW